MLARKKRSTLRNRADKLFSQLIRARDKCCLKCGTTEDLQCAHIIGRSYKAVRWDEANAIALCRSDHLYYTHRPLEWIDFIGETRFFELKRLAQAPHPRPDYETLNNQLEKRLQEVSA